MRWFEQHRQEWIREMLHVYGFINREHIQKKFGISTPQASMDLRTFQENNRYAIRYNLTTKRYEATEAFPGVRKE